MSDNKPRDWKNYEDFAAGIATNRLKTTDALVGKRLQLQFANEAMSLNLPSAHEVAWKDGRGKGVDWCEVIEVAPNTYFYDMTFASRPREALTVIVNTKSKRVLAVRSVVRPTPVAGEPQVQQEFLAGTLGKPEAGTGVVPAPTRDLIGLRAFYTYSPEHTLLW
jgi:hypothetical protein